MEFYDQTAARAAEYFGSDVTRGLSGPAAERNRKKYGQNKLTEKKKSGFFARLFSALKEPMLIILMFGFVIAFGSSLGKFLKSGESDFGESLGILAAIALSVGITLFMEGSSEKAFSALKSIYDNLSVKVIREGEIIIINQSLVVAGDIILLEAGDKIVADGRLIESESLSVDESALTGESHSGFKDAGVKLVRGTPLAERKNSVYSGTFVRAGSGKMIATSVGDDTEIGRIAAELKGKKEEVSPLSHKLDKLGKIITATGAAAAVFVLVLSLIRLSRTGNFNFENVQEACISCIILIVAAVPEGLPTIVAVSLALNMIKLAKENALIKKMAATETAGAVSVICSDKTGTLTKNVMTVTKVCFGKYCLAPGKNLSEELKENFVLNSTARVLGGKTAEYSGSGTECALLAAAKKSDPGLSVEEYRERGRTVSRVPFSSENKYMITVIKRGSGIRAYIKGAPEKVLSFCEFTEKQKEILYADMDEHRKNAARIICFAHKDAESFTEKGSYVFDGFAVIEDPVRPDVKDAVKQCFDAGIKVKMLTGDNSVTAFAVAKQLGIADSPSQVVNASEIENADDETLKKALPGITVVARSTPATKLRIVKLLKELGEVVAVTGDGINDAPAIRRADVGVAMGKSGSEITKEAADVILLNDGFATIVKAVAFGRNVYKNLQRFILFQLSVNLSALLFVTVCAVMGMPAPFNAIELLWINVIMDGPPALTLGLEKAGASLMKNKPVKRSDGIVGGKMFLRILFNGLFIGGIMLAEYFTDFLCAGDAKGAAVFTLFVLFQLFNAFNCRELGRESIFKKFGANKVMVATFAGVLLLHVIIVTFFYGAFGVTRMPVVLWFKCVLVAFSVIIVSEGYKAVYRLFVGKNDKNVKVSREVKFAAVNKFGRKA